jgi:transposase
VCSATNETNRRPNRNFQFISTYDFLNTLFSSRAVSPLCANDVETSDPREFTLEGRGQSIKWLCPFTLTKRHLPAASPELLDRPRRRTFMASDKLRILRQADEAEPGGIGAILRREGLYSSLLTDWRRQRDAGAYEALKAIRRGPKVASNHPLAAEHAQLLRDNKRLALRLQRAEAVIEIQKKVALLLGLTIASDEPS